MTALQEAAMRKALEALETCSYGDYSAKHVVDPSFDGDAVEAAIESLKAALAQQELPQKERPDFMAGYDAGMADAKRMAQQGEPVAWYEYNQDLDAWFLTYVHNPKVKARPLVFGDTAAPAPVAQEPIAMLFGTLPVYDTPAPQPAQDVPETDFGNMPTGCACRWDANDNRVATCVRHQGWLDVVREWADRAKAAEAALKSAQPAQGERDDSYPFYELKYIMRVLGSAGDAPKQDWQTAHGMARGIFTRWHKDALQSAQPVAQQAQTLGEIVNKWQATPGALVHPDLAKAVSELQPVRASTNTT